MAGPTYTSNLARRDQFQHTNEGGKFIPMICSKTQRSGGILNRKRAYKILVRPPSSTKPDIQVKSVAAEKERAISEFKEIMRNDEPHMPLKKSKKMGFYQTTVKHQRQGTHKKRKDDRGSLTIHWKKKTLKTKRKTTWKKEIEYQGISYVLGKKNKQTKIILT